MKEQEWSWIHNNWEEFKKYYNQTSKEVSKITDKEINQLKNNFMKVFTYVKNKSQNKELINEFEKLHKEIHKFNKKLSDSEKKQIEHIFMEIEKTLKQLQKAA
ncbi:MAG: hypothetical protein JXA94_03075 [Parachlamydiales bacterium]|nr:hypothetical protein [Parachlamydiales bacterium]